MSTHRHIDRICCVVIVLAMVLTVVLMNGESLGIQAASRAMGYETRLFDTAQVHTIDIVMDDWEGFLETCTDEEYVLCDLVIDGEAYTSVAIRAKGNTSLSQVASYGNGRYSFKVEFDHYDSAKTYHGLDKLCLNNIIQDNTYLKDYLTYQLMYDFGVSAPLCSFVYLTVNGEEWGLYLAVEGVEEAFLESNYGSDYGELYKPDSMSMGGGRGNGADFDLEGWMESRDDGDETDSAVPDFELPELPDFQPGEAGAQLPAAPPDDAAASGEAATAGESGQSAPTGGGRQQFGGMGDMGGKNPFDASGDFSSGMTSGGETASETDSGADTQAIQSQTTAEALPDDTAFPSAPPTGGRDQGVLQTTAMDTGGGDSLPTGETAPADAATDNAPTGETVAADDTTDSAASEAEATPAEDADTDAAAPAEVPDTATGETGGAWGGAGDRFSLDGGGQRPTGDEMPWQQGTENAAAAEPESVALLIACVAVLAAGILAAALYRRRG